MPVHVKTLEKTEESWCLTHLFFLRPWLWGDTVLYIQYYKKIPRRAEKINVHAARDGTAAGRHGGAPREHLIFS